MIISINEADLGHLTSIINYQVCAYCHKTQYQTIKNVENQCKLDGI